MGSSFSASATVGNPPLESWDKYGVVFVLITTVIYVMPRAFVSWHLHKRTLTAAGMTRDAYIYAAMCRWFQLLLNDHQLAAMQNERYDKINERLLASRPSEDTTTYLEPVTDQPFKATWVAKNLDSENKSKVLLWFHGGGYGYGQVNSYFSVLLNLYDKLAAVSCPTSILFLDYSLTPAAKYPTQLVEAAQIYNYLINDLKIAPARIIVGGDSAGGNLTLQLFRHIAEPRADIPITFSASSRPAKCILCSPWVSLKHESPSFETNRKRDVVVREKVEWYAKRWKGDHSDVFTDPIDAPVDSWKSILPATLVVSGELEIFIDDIKEICEKFKKSGVEVIEDHRRGKYHDWWWVEQIIGVTEDPKVYEGNEKLRDFIADSM